MSQCFGRWAARRSDSSRAASPVAASPRRRKWALGHRRVSFRSIARRTLASSLRRSSRYFSRRSKLSAPTALGLPSNAWCTRYWTPPMAVMAPTMMANGGKLSYGWSGGARRGRWVSDRARAGARRSARGTRHRRWARGERVGDARTASRETAWPQRCDATRGAEAGVPSSLGYDSLVDPLPRKAVRARTGAARVSFDEIIAV